MKEIEKALRDAHETVEAAEYTLVLGDVDHCIGRVAVHFDGLRDDAKDSASWNGGDGQRVAPIPLGDGVDDGTGVILGCTQGSLGCCDLAGGGGGGGGFGAIALVGRCPRLLVLAPGFLGGRRCRRRRGRGMEPHGALVEERSGGTFWVAVDVADVAGKHTILAAEGGKSELFLGGDPLVPQEPVRGRSIAVDAEAKGVVDATTVVGVTLERHVAAEHEIEADLDDVPGGEGGMGGERVDGGERVEDERPEVGLPHVYPFLAELADLVKHVAHIVVDGVEVVVASPNGEGNEVIHVLKVLWEFVVVALGGKLAVVKSLAADGALADLASVDREPAFDDNLVRDLENERERGEGQKGAAAGVVVERLQDVTVQLGEKPERRTALVEMRAHLDGGGRDTWGLGCLFHENVGHDQQRIDEFWSREKGGLWNGAAKSVRLHEGRTQGR